MPEWIEANIHHLQNPNEFLLTSVKPFIRDLENSDQLQSFHIFREPGPRILLRILLSNENINEIKNRIRNWENREDISQIEFREYQGEESSFGVGSWETAYKFLEVSSRVFLDLIDDTIEKGNNFNISSLNHYFLNICGLSIPEEAIKHFEMVVGRLYAQRYYDIKDISEKIQRIEAHLQRLENSISTRT